MMEKVIAKLEQIARLGNEPYYGNSKGNMLAQDCLSLLGAGDMEVDWNPWYGGDAPVKPDEPIRIWWSNGIKRTYPRGDYIVWQNLQTGGSVRWRMP